MHVISHVDNVIQKLHHWLHIFQLYSHLVSQLLAIGQLFAANVAHYANQRPAARRCVMLTLGVRIWSTS